jgi:hypothetical protein
MSKAERREEKRREEKRREEKRREEQSKSSNRNSLQLTHAAPECKTGPP